MWNNELFANINLGFAAAIPVIVALVQVVKMTGWVQAKYAPFVSIAIGILIAFLMGQDGNTWGETILSGILFGLAASGLYSGVQTSAHAIKADKHEALMKKDKQKHK